MRWRAWLGVSIEEVQANRLDVAGRFATEHGVHVVLKGHRTVVATPAGRAFINPTGNPGMATGGTGDVLTGMLAAWLAQLLDAEAACQLAVFLHGAAGDLAAESEGQAVDDGRRPGPAPRRGVSTRGAPARARGVGLMPASRSPSRRPPPKRWPANWRRGSSPATWCCSRGRSAPARPRSCAAWPGASAWIPEDVSSPTFAIVHEYRGGRLPLFHVDLYRLTPAAADDLGLHEMGVGEGVLAVEWPERLGTSFPQAIAVRLASVDDAGETVRRITIDDL